MLLLSRSGIPISFDQIEERLRTQDRASTDEVIKSKVYRDSSGRIRTEESMQIDLIDPVAGFRILLLSTERVACRMPWPKSAEGKFAFLGITDEAASWGNSTATSEHIGKRTIEGIEFDGTRIIQTAEGGPRLTATLEDWYSDELKLIGFVVASSPHETYTTRIQNLRREEPDPTLFTITIPPDYEMVDLQLPLPDAQ